MRYTSGILGLGLLSVATGVFAGGDEAIRVIIKYTHQPLAPVSLTSKILKSSGFSVQALRPMANGAYALELRAPGLHKGDGASVLARLRTHPEVLYAVTDRVGHFKPLPTPKTDTHLSQLLSHESQWDEFTAPGGIMLESKPGVRDGAWAYTTGMSKKPVVVAVLDTGIAEHPHLQNSLVQDEDGAVFGWNFSGNNRDLSDETKSYHGTHVAGTIAGYGDVMMGVGADLKVLPIKIPDAQGMFYESAVINAIYWSVGGDVPGVPNNKYPAKVLNMSFGVDIEPGTEMDYCDEALQEAVWYARKQGAVLAVAAGNDNVWEHYNAPAVCNGTIKVASTGPEGLRSYFSNYGPGVTLAAPGGDMRYGAIGGILSTVNPGGGYQGSGFDFYQGTSMASPHVAGVAGLIYAVSERAIKPERVEQILYLTTHDFGESTDPNKSCVGKKPCGHGILDAENAVKATINAYDVVFSAPSAADFSAAHCVQGGVQTATSFWSSEDKTCPHAIDAAVPHVLRTKEGQIIATYGTMRLALDMHSYASCDVIGYDGVGCYLHQ